MTRLQQRIGAIQPLALTHSLTLIYTRERSMVSHEDSGTIYFGYILWSSQQCLFSLDSSLKREEERMCC